MRKKEPSLLISFHTTTEAMALEAACQEAGLPGRLIPIPSFVSAGCGFGWKVSEEAGVRVMDLVREKGMKYKKTGIYLL